LSGVLKSASIITRLQVVLKLSTLVDGLALLDEAAETTLLLARAESAGQSSESILLALLLASIGTCQLSQARSRRSLLVVVETAGVLKSSNIVSAVQVVLELSTLVDGLTLLDETAETTLLATERASPTALLALRLGVLLGSAESASPTTLLGLLLSSVGVDEAAMSTLLGTIEVTGVLKSTSVISRLKILLELVS